MPEVATTRFQEALRSGRFLVTAEISPPKGVDVADALARAEALKGCVDAVNVTDRQGAVMATNPVALAHLLLARGLEPILQMTCRDRNRIALQSDLLAAHVLGVRNVLCLTGDPPGTGDHPQAKAVLDLEAIGLLETASALIRGHDLSGNRLIGAPRFCLGAAVDPGAADLSAEIDRMERKAEAGATFFQTQAVFDAEAFARFIGATRHLKMPILAGVIVLKSGEMARQLGERLPGVHVPDAVVTEMTVAEDRLEKGIEIAGRIASQVSGLAQGVHIMAMGWEHHVPQVLERAGLLSALSSRPGVSHP